LRFGSAEEITRGAEGEIAKNIAAVPGKFSSWEFGEPISHIQSAADGEGAALNHVSQQEMDVLVLFFGEDLRRWQVARFFDRAGFRNILDCVRDKVLTWALALEQEEVLGRKAAEPPEHNRAAPDRASGVQVQRVSTLLMMAVNPETEEEDEQLLVAQEQQKIFDARDASRFQDSIRIEPLRDASFARLAKSLRLHKPTAFHLSGHGRPDGSIVLFDEENQPYAMNAEGLAKLFCVHKGSLKLVVLSCCHSQVLAMLLTTDIDAVIGMDGEIDDDAAILFSDVLYNALFDGATVGDAFNTAHSALS
jgi:hypothetical protein